MVTAFLFPGQGAQQPGMLSFPGLCQDTLDEAKDFLDSRKDLTSLSELDTPDALSCTIHSQLSLLIVGAAAARAWIRRDLLPAPEVVCGHSVGAYAAAVVAEVMTLTEALHAVALRAKEMERACENGEWGMIAVLGIDARDAQQMATDITAAGQDVWVANINSRRQVVFSGTRAGMQAVSAAAEKAGADRVEKLAVPVASHCPLQQPAQKALEEYFSTLEQRAPKSIYLTNTRGRRAWTGTEVLKDLAESVSRTVQWRTIIEILPELDVHNAVEMPPGHVLTLLSDSEDMHALSLAELGFSRAEHRIQLLNRQ